MSKKTEQNIINRNKSNFSKRFQSIMYSEPKHLALIGLYLILCATILLGLWSFFSIVNKSQLVHGEIRTLKPDVSISVPENFSFGRFLVRMGENVKKDQALFEYYNASGEHNTYPSPMEGIISHKSKLKKNILYPANMEIASIRSEDSDLAIRLYIPESIINMVEIGTPVVLRFHFPLQTRQAIRATVITKPVELEKNYVAEAKIDEESLKILQENNVRLINGLAVNAEVIFGEQRLLERILGVSL